MPSSGLPMVNLMEGYEDAQMARIHKHIEDCAQEALKYGLFVEWLESFIGAYAETKNPHIAAEAGCTEWDF